MTPSVTHVSGTVTGDAEVRFTDSGVAVCRFRLTQPPTQWDAAAQQWRDGTPIRYVCTAWRDLARNATESLTDGVSVLVTGRVTDIRDNAVNLSVDDLGTSLHQRIASTENSLPSRTCLRAFLNWAMQIRHCPRSLSLPAMKVSRRAALSDDERLDALGRLLTDTKTPLRLRVAGVIVLLYAQPVSRIVRLTLDDVIRDGDTVLLRLGESPSPVPAPVADLLLEHIANRDNMNTATNPASRWLFPGRRAGQPFGPDHLSALLNEVGIPIAAARGAAIRQQLLELPAPVVADALGYHDKTTSRLRNETGGTWSRYAAGDHGRSPVGWAPKTTGEN
ncbi:single-stranded DNA-binding protein [Streptomyces bobili]|uniref:single-stranded DNA-binding protein n=1 Tax=Streptomyces bobili TaxID=67280 RepID=UPI00342E7FBE